MTTTPVEAPRYLQIADELRIQIEDGSLQPGDELPSLADLCRQWGVSQGVARQAVALLRQQALITSGQGKRPTVRRRDIAIAATNQKHLREKEAISKPESERRASGTLEANTGIALSNAKFRASYEQILNAGHSDAWPDGTPLLQREYQTSDYAGQRLLWSRSYLPLELIAANPDLLDETAEPWPGGTQHQLSTVGIEIAEMRDIVTARAATSVEAAEWAMQPGEPMLCVSGRAIDTTGQTVVAGETRYPAGRASIEYVTPLPKARQCPQSH